MTHDGIVFGTIAREACGLHQCQRAQGLWADLRNALLQAYERKSGHRPMAEHQTREAFTALGLPWIG